MAAAQAEAAVALAYLNASGAAPRLIRKINLKDPRLIKWTELDLMRGGYVVRNALVQLGLPGEREVFRQLVLADQEPSNETLEG